MLVFIYGFLVADGQLHYRAFVSVFTFIGPCLPEKDPRQFDRDVVPVAGNSQPLIKLNSLMNAENDDHSWCFQALPTASVLNLSLAWPSFSVIFQSVDS